MGYEEQAANLQRRNSDREAVRLLAAAAARGLVDENRVFKYLSFRFFFFFTFLILLLFLLFMLFIFVATKKNRT
jgi:hypothetical protein